MQDEWMSESEGEKWKQYNEAIQNRFGNHIMEWEVEDTLDPHANISALPIESTPTFEPYGGDVDGDEPMMPNVDEWDADTCNAYITAQVALPHGEKTVLATVKR